MSHFIRKMYEFKNDKMGEIALRKNLLAVRVARRSYSMGCPG